MGFFSSRKTDDRDNYHVTAMIGGGGNNDKSVVQVIRSRFYGKKGKQREEPITYIPQSTSVAQTLSIGSSTLHIPTTSSPLAASSSRLAETRSPSRAQNERPLPPTPAKKRLSSKPDMPPAASSPSKSTRKEGHARMSSSSTTASRKGTDTVTTSLAQRLNELAVANAEGLLNEDEYRLLRQNLFERFASVSEIPSETPIVPLARPRPKQTGPSTSDRSSRPLSNFQVDMPRPPSSQSRNSIASGMANLFRRTSTASGSKDVSDTSSIWSRTSTSSNKFKFSRILSRKSSSSSIKTTASRNIAETMSISSRRGGGGSGYSLPEMTRRRLATPPSSFPSAMKQQERKYASNSIYNVFDEDHLSSTAEIRQEILAVEAEARRLMDAFTGLEITTMSKTQRSRGYSVTRSEAGRVSNVGSVKRPNMAESDAGSIRSGTSVATGLSTGPKSVHSNRMALRPKTSLNVSLALSTTSSRPSSLRRKNSASSIKSHGIAKMGGTMPVPPLPTHAAFGQVNGASSSNVSLARSAHVMASVPEDDTRSVSRTIATTVRLDDETESDNETEDIRRRREEVQMRYEARLDYLRAKLKSAELHEKLLRK